MKTTTSCFDMVGKARLLTEKLTAASNDYSFVLCTTPELLIVSQQLRHQVYCEELGWETITASHNEQDSYDQHASHYLVLEKITQRPIATFRIIGGSNLPVNHVDSFSESHLSHPLHRRHDALCEISRFSIVKDYRNTALHQAMIIFAAYSAIQQGFHAMYSIMERKFASTLKKFHIAVSQLTDTFEHHGQRAIFMICRHDVMPLMTELAKGDASLTAMSSLFSQTREPHFELPHCA